MKCELTHQCGYCRSHITVENSKEVIEKIVDGRRHLSVICCVCGEEVLISSKWI